MKVTLARLAAIFVMSIALCAPAPSAIAADTHIHSCDSVRSGRINFKDRTNYNDALTHAVREWNALGTVQLVKSGAAVVEVQVWDYSANDGNGGTYTCNGRISLNTQALGSPSDTSGNKPHLRRHVAVHEFGHALRLADHDRKYCGSVYEPSAMAPCEGRRYAVPTAHDKGDYRRYWGPNRNGGCAVGLLLAPTCDGEPVAPELTVDASESIPTLEVLLTLMDLTTQCRNLYAETCGEAYGGFVAEALDATPHAYCQTLYGATCGQTFGPFAGAVIDLAETPETRAFCRSGYNGQTCGQAYGSFIRDLVDFGAPYAAATCRQYYGNACGTTFGGFAGSVIDLMTDSI